MLSGPLIVLFVKVVVDVPVIIVLSTAKVKSLPEIVDVIPVPPKILIVSPLAEILVTVELSSANLTIPLILVPSPIAVYISVKLLLIFSAPRRRLSPVPSFGVGSINYIYCHGFLILNTIYKLIMVVSSKVRFVLSNLVNVLLNKSALTAN